MRQALAVLLAVVAGAAAVGGAAAWSVRDDVIARDAFVHRAVVALDRAPVRDAIDAEIAQQVLARVPSGAVAPDQVGAAVARATATGTFRRAFRRGARDVHAALFSDRRDRSATLRVDVADLLTRVDPRLAPIVGGGASAHLVTVDTGSLPVDSRRLADLARAVAVGLPILAALALAGALLVARRRRTALGVAALTAVVCGSLLLVGLGAGRSAVVDAAGGSGGIDPGQARAAAGTVWDVYAGGPHTTAIVAIVAGAVVAGGALLLGGARR